MLSEILNLNFIGHAFFTYKGHEPLLWICPLNSVLLFYCAPLGQRPKGHRSTANSSHICARKLLCSMVLPIAGLSPAFRESPP